MPSKTTIDKENNPIFDKQVIEFITVAIEFCQLMEQHNQHTKKDFSDRMLKILPLLYIKGSLLPRAAMTFPEALPEPYVTEALYEHLRNGIAALLGEDDAYLETFEEDMRYSDRPIGASISENLADIFQDIGDFVVWFRQGNEDSMHEALMRCSENFAIYWGQKLLNALKALHAIYYRDAFVE